MRKRFLMLGLCLVALSSAQAERAWSEPEEPGAEIVDEPVSAADVRQAPRPGQASGVRVARDTRQYRWLWVPRTLLFVPRVTSIVLFAPLRGSLFIYERYELHDRLRAIFFNRTGTMGLYPLAFVETGFGSNVGLRFVYRDLFGAKGALRLRASYGGRFRQLYAGSMTTGRLLGERVELTLRGESEIFPKARFYGIGNHDVVPISSLTAAVDPLRDDTAVATRYRHDDYRVSLAARVNVHPDISLDVSGSASRRSFDGDVITRGDALITDAYDADGLIGFDGRSSVQGELELTYDSRRATRDYLSLAKYAAGWKVQAYTGYAVGLGNNDTHYGRFGFDVQHMVDIYQGDRVLLMRLFLDAVTSDLEQVPFTDLPFLGGPLILRGYPRQRFRDRVAALATLEYRYPIQGHLSGFVFVDSGRVYRSLSDLSAHDARVGFGGGLQLIAEDTFLARLSMASSMDGSLFFNLDFDPVFDSSARKESP